MMGFALCATIKALQLPYHESWVTCEVKMNIGGHKSVIDVQ